MVDYFESGTILRIHLRHRQLELEEEFAFAELYFEFAGFLKHFKFIIRRNFLVFFWCFFTRWLKTENFFYLWYLVPGRNQIIVLQNIFDKFKRDKCLWFTVYRCLSLCRLCSLRCTICKLLYHSLALFLQGLNQFGRESFGEQFDDYTRVRVVKLRSIWVRLWEYNRHVKHLLFVVVHINPKLNQWLPLHHEQI